MIAHVALGQRQHKESSCTRKRENTRDIGFAKPLLSQGFGK